MMVHPTTIIRSYSPALTVPQEKNPFVVVLIDGDGMIVRPSTLVFVPILI
jgi:hypothetical protein